MSGLRKTYNWLARQFHWLTVPFVILAFCLGLVMTGLPLSPLKLSLFAWHKWIGILILGLVGLRLIWRLVSPRPEYVSPSTVPSFVHFLSKLGHGALYGLLLALPLIGWARSSTAGIEIKLFEVVPLPDLLAKDEVFSKQLALWHEWGAWALLVLLVGHVGAVVLHHKVWQDPVLAKMPASWLHKGLVGLGLFMGGGVIINALVFNPPQLVGETQKQVKTVPVTQPVSQMWRVDAQASKLEFSAQQKGAATTGYFKTVQLAALRFSRDEPERAEVTVRVETGSLVVGNTMVEQALTSSGWFNSAEFPYATFTAKGFVPVKEGGYRLNGFLTIKGITKPLSVVLKITEQNDEASGADKLKAVGHASISRSAYNIGEGEWAGSDVLADEVQLSIDITAIKVQ